LRLCYLTNEQIKLA